MCVYSLMAKYWGCLILGVPHELHEHSEHDNSWALFAWRSMAKLLGFSPEIPDFSNWKDPPCYQWVNPLFLWVMFNSYVTNYQRVSSMSINLYSDRTSDRTILNICTCFLSSHDICKTKYHSVNQFQLLWQVGIISQNHLITYVMVTS